jgi:hypothetical protein
MFITDTVDAVYPPENWSTRSLLDRLGEVMRNIPSNEKVRMSPKLRKLYLPNVHDVQEIDAMAADLSGNVKTAVLNLRGPILSRVTSAPDLSLLTAFLTHVSLNSYESLYNSRGQIDWSAVEENLLSDIFSGSHLAPG